MAAKNGTSGAARPKSVVMSVRVWPDVAAGFHDLAAETGLSQAALLANALDLLRADPHTKELISAAKAYDAAFARITSRRKTAPATK